MTLRDTIIGNLTRLGYTEVKDGSFKYTLMHKHDGGNASFAWVGTNGACRVNGIKRVDGSRTVGSKTREFLLTPLREPLVTKLRTIPPVA